MDGNKSGKSVGKGSRGGGKGRYVTLTIYIPEPGTEPGRSRRPPVPGRRSGLGVGAFFATLFRANELLKRHKMTDWTIENQVCLEFPDQPCSKALLSGSKTVGEWRGLYNSGDLTGGEKPEVPSKRYDGLGNVVNPKSGKPMTQAERERWSKKYGYTY